jgi:hypothetical protein
MLFPSVFSVLKPPNDLMHGWLRALCVKASKSLFPLLAGVAAFRKDLARRCGLPEWG